MSAKKLKNIRWYLDPRVKERGEPGITHSYMASLATAINYMESKLDPVWLMGSSAFAFRIFINEIMCPSAMSIFDFSTLLPQAVEQAGYKCTYVCRYWNEEDKEEEKRLEAQAAIIAGIDRGAPAIVWDIYDDEWGLIIGYDWKKRKYTTMTCKGKITSLAYDRLGRNGIDILSVTIPGEENKRGRQEVILTSLQACVAHAEQKEWLERPKYQNGLAAYDLWASIFEKWAMIVDAGRGGNIGADIPRFARYYAGHYYSARCYARDYLAVITNGNTLLSEASSLYQQIPLLLKPVWDNFSKKKKPDGEVLRMLAENIKEAKNVEEKAVGLIKKHISMNVHDVS